MRFSSVTMMLFLIDWYLQKLPKQEGEVPQKKTEPTERKVQELINEIINDFQSRGAVNILIKDEAITTLSGLPALKILAPLIIKKRKKKRVRCNYTTHVFDFEQGDQPDFALRKG